MKFKIDAIIATLSGRLPIINVNNNNAPSSIPRYFILIGRMKNSITSKFGNNTAKAKNNDKFK